jgi:hypothetical protein
MTKSATTYRSVGGELYELRNGRSRHLPLHVDPDRSRTAQCSPDPLDRLRDVVAMFADYPADFIAVTTAGDLSGWAAGLTVGDLRALLNRLSN